MLKIARIAIKKNAAFSDCIVVFGVKPYIVPKLLYITNKKFKRYLNQKQFNGIYDKNVYFIEDLLENNTHLIDIFDENIQNI